MAVEKKEFKREQEGGWSGGRDETREGQGGRIKVADGKLFFSSRRRNEGYWRDWSSDVCSSDLRQPAEADEPAGLDRREVADHAEQGEVRGGDGAGRQLLRRQARALPGQRLPLVLQEPGHQRNLVPGERGLGAVVLGRHAPPPRPASAAAVCRTAQRTGCSPARTGYTRARPRGTRLSEERAAADRPLSSGTRWNDEPVGAPRGRGGKEVRT